MTYHDIDLPQAWLAGLCRRRNHIRRLSLFGSVLRDDFGPDSDVDMLAEFEPGETPSLLTMAGLEIELAQARGTARGPADTQGLEPVFPGRGAGRSGPAICCRGMDQVRVTHMLDAAREAMDVCRGAVRAPIWIATPCWRVPWSTALRLWGEAAAHIGAETCVRSGTIPWAKIVGMRNRLVHAYFDIDQGRSLADRCRRPPATRAKPASASGHFRPGKVTGLPRAKNSRFASCSCSCSCSSS